MLTGQLPFKGDYEQAVMYSIMHEDPEPPTALRTGVPMELERIVLKALAKEPGERYQSMQDILVDLKRAKRVLESEKSGVTKSVVKPQKGRNLGFYTGAVAFVVLLVFAVFYFSTDHSQKIESIAVLPFVNASGNAEIEYLSDGMTETLITSLSQLPKLNVKARSSVFRYKDKETNPHIIGQELNVQAILNGRIVQRGEQLTLSLELVNVQTENVIWSEQYNRKQADLVALQNEIARDVSSKLKTKLSGADIAELTRTYTANPEAYELYLKGKYYANQYTEEGIRRSIDRFNQAIAIDPDYSSAHSGLAYSYILLDDWFESPHECAPKARDAAKKALAINETDVDAHVVLGIVAHWYDWDWAAAEREFKRSLELNPQNSESYIYYAWFLSAMQRHEEAFATSRQGLQIDPLFSGTNFSMASTLIFSHRWDDAIAHLHKAIELDPNYWFHHSYLGRAYEQKGMMPEAIAEFKLALELDRQQSENWAGLGHAYAVSGKKTEAQKMIDDLMKRSSEDNYVAAYNIAVIYVGLGDRDKAFAWLERAYADRSYYLPVYLTTDARLDSLHSDPRFKDLVRRIGLPWRD